MTVLADEGREQRWFRIGVASAALASALVRLRHLGTDLTVDEAGALVVARAWAAGAQLYTEVFIDRPQGFVGAYRAWDALGLPPSSVRIVAAVGGAVAVLASGALARSLGGSWQAGVAGAWLVAIWSSSPALEGHTANAELLAAALSVPAVAVAARVVRTTDPAGLRWLAVAGGLGGAALTVKQSAFDALVAAVLFVLVARLRRWWTTRQVIAGLALVAAGAAVPVGAALLHGASLGWDAYIEAMVTFRARVRSLGAGVQWGRLAITSTIAAVLAVGPLVVARRADGADGPHPPADARVRLLVLLWLWAAAAGLLIGGNYHRHYWIQIAIPAGILVGARLGGHLAAPGQPAPLIRRLVAALWLPAAITVVLCTWPALEADRRVADDRAVVAALSRGGGPTPTVLPLCASATLYLFADQAPALPELWLDHLRHRSGAPEHAAALLDAPDGPAVVVVHQPLQRCDPTGSIRRALARRYQLDGEQGGAQVWVRLS